MINVLYGILTNGEQAPSAYSWYDKVADNPMHTPRIDALRTAILTGVPANQINFFACCVCSLIKHTEFGTEIMKLDENNTYNVTLQRPLTAPHSDDAYTMHQLMQPIDAYIGLKAYLDKDISDRLTAPVWLDYMAAGCLQILREVFK